MIYANWWIFHEARLFGTATSPYLSLWTMLLHRPDFGSKKAPRRNFLTILLEASVMKPSPGEWREMGSFGASTSQSWGFAQGFAGHICKSPDLAASCEMLRGVTYASRFCLSRSHLELNHANVPMNSCSRWGKLTDVNVSKSGTSHGPGGKTASGGVWCPRRGELQESTLGFTGNSGAICRM